MDTGIIFDYLRGLKENNNREWYHEHKKEYQEANAAFLKLIEELIYEIGKTDSSILNNDPKGLTFKLVRDTRFSKDKSPYNPSFRAHIAAKGKLPIPVGYFLMLAPDNQSFLGGGLFADMFKDATERIRRYIAGHGEEWESIIHSPEFTKHFTVEGTALKNVPAGYDKEHAQAEYLKYKCWYLEYHLKDGQIAANTDFVKTAAEIFIAMKPFNDFLNKALEGFEMPQRPN